AQVLGEWAARLRAEDIPAAVRDNAALRVLDTIGCALAGAREEHAPSVLALASRWGGPGRSTVGGTTLTAAPPQAALAGAPLAAGKSLGLDASRLTAAVGIAGSMASGVMEFLEDGSWVKRLHPGWAAQSGIQAAALAQGGFTGPATALEGRLGFYRAALGDVPDIAKQLKNLGGEWETVRSSFKLYPCCHLNHAYLDAVARLKRAEGLRPEQVEEVECLVPAGEIPIVCEPAAAKLRPRSPYD